MKLTHSGEVYECKVAVKCESDKYIKLYDKNGVEIASFHNISDFSEYALSGGSYKSPCDCTMPIPLGSYAIGGCTISKSDWVLSDGRYSYEIENGLISANATTCNILLFFAEGTEFEYEASQQSGKITLYVDAAPENDIVIDGIQITRV